jgi:hypothetical protein
LEIQLAERSLKGPITGWDYPLLNAIIERIRRWREKWRKRLYGQLRLRDIIETTETRTTKTEAKTKIYENVEEYSIYEDKGVIKVRVKRKAERE